MDEEERVTSVQQTSEEYADLWVLIFKFHYELNSHGQETLLLRALFKVSNRMNLQIYEAPAVCG